MARNRSFNDPSDDADTAATDAPAPAPAVVDQPPATGTPAAEAVEAKPKRYVVAPGASLVGARGKLGPGDPIHDGELSSEQLEAFVAAGAVVEA